MYAQHTHGHNFFFIVKSKFTFFLGSSPAPFIESKKTFNSLLFSNLREELRVKASHEHTEHPHKN